MQSMEIFKWSRTALSHFFFFSFLPIHSQYEGSWHYLRMSCFCPLLFVSLPFLSLLYFYMTKFKGRLKFIQLSKTTPTWFHYSYRLLLLFSQLAFGVDVFCYFQERHIGSTDTFLCKCGVPHAVGFIHNITEMPALFQKQGTVKQHELTFKED